MSTEYEYTHPLLRQVGIEGDRIRLVYPADMSGRVMPMSDQQLADQGPNRNRAPLLDQESGRRPEIESSPLPTTNRSPPDVRTYCMHARAKIAMRVVLDHACMQPTEQHGQNQPKLHDSI